MIAIRAGSVRRPSLIVVLFCAFTAVLWIAGGASRADAAGQIAVRLTAAAVLVCAALLGPRPVWRPERPVWAILGACVLLVIWQSLPLPSAWGAVPASDALDGLVPGMQSAWRPLAVVFGAVLNAGFSLLVPLAALVLMSMTEDRDRRFVPVILLVTIAGGAMLGLLQMSGSTFDNPLINETVGQPSGNFANRNHFGLFLALGCLLAPAWAVSDGSAQAWRAAVAGACSLLFLLLVLGTGSRAGLVLCVIAVVIGLVLARDGLRRLSRGLPRWALPAIVVGFIALLGIAVLVSLVTDRAVGIERLQDVNADQDMRTRGLPVVLAMIRAYLPLGSGLGAFDPFFEMHEPVSLLKPTIFNHAHNDYLEIAMAAGLPGLLILAASIIWWGLASVRMWRAPVSQRVVLARLGSAMLLLVLLASVVDYPARTPMMMVTVVIAATLLSWGRTPSQG